MINISFKAYNSKKLKHIHRQINTASCVWNHCIALNKRYYRLYGGYINLNKLQKHIAKLRNRNASWKALNSQTVQEICERVDMSYRRFFKKLSKCPPKFKKAKNFNSFVLKQSGWGIDNNVLRIGKRRYKFSKSRDYENIKRITVKRNKIGEVFFILFCDMKPKRYKREGDSSIGMDFGLKTYLTLSSEVEIKSPEFFKNNISRIKKANQNLSTKERGSNNRKRAIKHLQRVHINVVNKRSDFEWKLAHELCKNNSFIAIEDLNMDAMKRLWGRKVSDLSFSSFVLKLEQVALKYNTIVQKVGRFYPSSKTCGCGAINKELKLSDREWRCPTCGVVNQRDLLASKNILTEGIRLCRTKSKTVVPTASLA